MEEGKILVYCEEFDEAASKQRLGELERTVTTPSGKTYTFGADGLCVMDADCGIELAGPCYEVREGVAGGYAPPQVSGVVKRDPGRPREVFGPAEYAGQTLTAPDGSQVVFQAKAVEEPGRGKVARGVCGEHSGMEGAGFWYGGYVDLDENGEQVGAHSEPPPPPEEPPAASAREVELEALLKAALEENRRLLSEKAAGAEAPEGAGQADPGEGEAAGAEAKPPAPKPEEKPASKDPARAAREAAARSAKAAQK